MRARYGHFVIHASVKRIALKRVTVRGLIAAYRTGDKHLGKIPRGYFNWLCHLSGVYILRLQTVVL